MPDPKPTPSSSAVDRALAESEERFRAAFEQTLLGIAVIDPQGRVLRVNDAFAQMVGRPASELIGRDSSHYTHPEDRELNAARIALVSNSGADSGSVNRLAFEKRYIRPDGNIVFARIHLSPMHAAGGSLIGLLGTIEDISDRRRADEILRQSEARLRFLAELDEQTRDLTDAETVMATSARMLGQGLGASRCAYAEVDPDGEQFTILHDYTDGCASTVGTYRLSLFGPGAAADQRSGRTLVVRDVDRELSGDDVDDDNGAAMFTAIGIKAVVCCPLVRRGQLMAMMAVHQTVPRDWTPAEVALVEAVAERSWAYLERARTARGLRNSEARLADIVRTALDCVVGMDEDGRVNEWNPAAEQTFGYTRSEAIGADMAQLIIPAQLRAMHRAGLARYLATGEATVLGRRLELSAVRRDGSEFPCELAITRTSRGMRPNFTAYVRDITARVAAERERDALLESERTARSDAEHASQMKDEFLATLSHELRTPLNAILGWSQIVRRPATAAKDIAQGLEVIERNARAQAQMIEDLLDMSRIVSGKVRLDVQRLDLASVVGAAVETARPGAEAKGVRLQSVIDPLQGVVVTGDASRLQQVLWNLIGNAIKFTPRGGRVQVLLERVNSHIKVSVIDTGEGIRADFLPHVFDRFRQADASTTRSHGGLGLGLSIVKQLVELHGGSVRAKSKGPGEGSTFAVALPITVLHPEPGDGPSARIHPRATPGITADRMHNVDLAGVHVLVVDDEPDARTLIRRLLEDGKATVMTAENADRAIEMLREQRPDVLVSDIGMPGEDGYSLIRRVRALGAANGGDVPAIALTAFARSEDRVRAVVAGFQMHVAKPVEPAELLTMVESLASSRR
jgi:PAS domain S-box-containing protein